MKRHVCKTEIKARLARRAERKAEQIAKDTARRNKRFPSRFGRTYRTCEALQWLRWICGRVQACKRAARDGSKLALRERCVLKRGGPGVWYVKRWEEMDRGSV